MSLVLNLKGTNGSGKSTAARSLLHEDADIVLVAGQKCTVSDNVCLVGPYPPNATSGGCDRIRSQDLMFDTIEEASRLFPMVVFEGIFLSILYGRLEAFCRTRVPFWWVFLDTPLEVCHERIRNRNGGKAYVTDEVDEKYRRVLRIRNKAIAAGFTVYDLHHESAEDELAAFALLG